MWRLFLRVKTMINENKPSYEFDAYLKADNQTPILCNVALWLPKDSDEDLHIEIDSPEKRNTVESFMGKFVSIESEIYQEKPQFAAVMSKVWIKQVSAQLENRKLSRTRIKILHAWDLSISEVIGNKDVDNNLVDTVYFQISNLLYAEPEANRCASYLGSRKAEIVKSYETKSPKDHTFKIEKHYSGYSNLSQNKEVVSSQNVISVTSNNKINLAELDELIKQVNDFALLLSFAARYQVLVLGYEYWTGTKRVRYYKNPTGRYKANKEEIVEDALIPKANFELFMSGALSKLHSIDEKIWGIIKDMIASIHPFNDSHQSYLNMFSAFEGVVNLFNTEVRTELDANWKGLEQDLNAFIDSQKFTESTKEFLKDDINGLRNREKFRSKTEYCLKELNVVVNDLWPIFGDNSLYQIRNRLAHGRRMELDSVYRIAQEQLQFLLERLVLVLLGFDYNKSTAGLTMHGIRFKYSKQEISDFQNLLKTNK